MTTDRKHRPETNTVRTIHFLTPILLLSALAGLTACASKPKQPTSSWRMIDEGEDNPFIHDAPEHAGTIIKDDRGPR